MAFRSFGFPAIATASVIWSVVGWSEARAETRTAFVHLFEWKWTDIAEECENHLGPKGFAAVQISPAQEHPIVNETVVKFPWWQRYQPVSYKLQSRSGTREELADMISRCNQAGVKVYADVVINHMAGVNAPATQTTAGSSFDAGNLGYPAVPYGRRDFHGQCDIDYSKAGSIRNCWVTGGLPDLTVETEHVRQKIADHMNDLISIGVAGFRIDAAKHMRPEDIGAVLAKVDDIGNVIDPNTGQAFHLKVERPYVFLEVIGAASEPVKPPEYTHLGNVTEFLYGTKIGEKFRDPNQNLSQLETFPGHPGSADWGLLPSFTAVAFLDNHDNQRGHGNGGWQSDGRIANILASHYDGNVYNLANVFMLAWPYGYPKVMSSYKWQRDVRFDQGDNKFKDFNDWKGPPAHSDGSTKGVDCNDEWVCEHRWDNIAEMVGFRNFTGQNQQDWTVTHWWDNGADQIAFGRNGKGFVIINKGGGSIANQQFDTGMPAGQYCEVLHADFDRDNGTCSETTITVDDDGRATFSVGEGQAAAIHGGARIGG